MHWDLRLEHDGALASWAIPNGIPGDPKRNRKAVHVEDHPLSYIDFQGTIPKGNYGAGRVTIWDAGTYACEKWEQDKVVVVFHGERLQGRYALFRAGRAEKDWMIHRMDPPADRVAREMPEFITPMLARLSTLPADENALLEKGRRVRGGLEVEVESRTLKLTNLSKVLYPAGGFTKADVIDYYAQIAPVLLPHLRDRPLTLKRYPNGVRGEYFYEKQSPAHRPGWVATTGIWSEHSKREIHYTLCQDLATLLWLANLADIELHPSLSTAVALERPTALAFDLDPGAPASIVECCEVALDLHDIFEELGLRAFAKTSGSKGLQVYVPLNAMDVTYEQTKPLAHAVANLLQTRKPELVVSAMAKAERTGKVLIDWSQNDPHKTTVSVYSLRAREHPTVSTPILWSEVTACREAEDSGLLTFKAGQVLARVAEQGDLFAEVGSLVQQLPLLEG